MSKRLAPLLPAEDGSEPSPFDSNSLDSKKKRVGTEIACNACRRRKTRCDGLRPLCAACRKRSTNCEYVEKRDGPKSSQPPDGSREVLDLLRSAPEAQAYQMLRLLRANGDFESVLSVVKGGMDVMARPSDRDTARVLRPATSTLEFELMVSNPTAYPALRQSPLTVFERQSLLKANRLHRSKSLDDQLQDVELNGQAPTSSLAGSTNMVPPGRILPDLSLENRSVLGEPGSTRQAPVGSVLCDSRLNDLHIGFWTDVPVADAYAARVISLYLTTDHPLLGVFDPDLFIHDLVYRRHNHCSRLLVNSLMYWGCQMFTALDEKASDLAQLFCTEAEQLWIQERESNTLLNAASAQLLSLAYLGHGKDHYVLNLTTLFYQQPGLEYPNHPPAYPIPGEGPTDYIGETSSTSSNASEDSLPAYMGKTFPALCRFWSIIHGVTLAYYKNQPTPLPDHVTLEFAEFKYRELLTCMETLPSDQVLRAGCPHHVVIFHIWFHAAVLDIFRPFVRRPRRERPRLKTFAAPQSTPDAAFNASVNQLKQLVVEYRCHYESSTYTLLWQTALIYVANAVLHETHDPQWRFYFLACIYAYEALRKPYRIAEVISRGLLTITLRDGDISGQEARRLLRQIKDVDGSHASGDVRATFMVDLDLAMTDPEAARVENLAERFEDIALFREFTTVDDDDARKFQRMESNGSGG
ncbi:zinc finger protein [Colletotrichum plurivorum]|uniref:Zinc finger protein n=1 Tax=Colletotrichum plurivorum TaxID=2175906 RepID=A0A8H6JKR4_9PEZI|nr:zinc finger protein [Colletotrichum plurivorum]